MDLSIETAGYPSDNVSFNIPMNSDRPRRDLVLSPGDGSIGTVAEITGTRRIVYTNNVDTAGGQSGNGIWHQLEGDEPRVMAIHSVGPSPAANPPDFAFPTLSNGGVLITTDIYNLIIDRIARDSGTTANADILPENAIIGTDPFLSLDGGAGSPKGLAPNVASDRLFGNEGSDIFRGGSGNDDLDGDGGNDRLYGNSGNDLLKGSTGNDFLAGGDGSDTLKGESSKDTLNGGLGNDLLQGGDNNDRLFGSGNSDRLFGNSGNDLLIAGFGNDRLAGSFGRDTLKGESGTDILAGGDNDDLLQGGDGNDSLSGQNGNDRLNGGSGQDTLAGGAGEDDFVFASSSQPANKITDFTVADDTMLFKASNFAGVSTLGMVSSDMLTIGSSADDSSDRFIYNSNSGDFFYDSDGTGSSQQVKLAKLNPGLALTNSHFELV